MTYVHLMEAFGTLEGGQVRYLKTTNALEPPYCSFLLRVCLLVKRRINGSAQM